MYNRRSRKLQTSQQKSPLPIGGLPVNCCGPAGSPGPLGSIATLSAFNNHKVSKKIFKKYSKKITKIPFTLCNKIKVAILKNKEFKNPIVY